MSWTRLKECYATPEVIESALFKRLDSFPRLTSRENIKLRELSDVLMELEMMGTYLDSVTLTHLGALTPSSKSYQ